MSDQWQGLAGNRLHPFHPHNQTNMTNLREGLPGTHFQQFHPHNQTNNSNRSTRSTEFEFWESRPMNELETMTDFQIPAQNGYGHDEHSPPPIWRTNNSINHEDYPPLLPCNNIYSNLSPKSKIQAILKGRKELMEVIQNIPESSYELSLKDIVDRNVLQESGEDIMKEDLDHKTGVPIQQKTKINKNSKAAAVKLHRSGSMDNNTFLLKVFFPTSLTVKKSTKGKYAKVTPRSPSLERSESRENKGWKKRFSITGQRSFSSGNSDSIRTRYYIRTRHTDSNLFSGCWPFPHTRKTKIWRQRGCFF